MDLSKNAVMAWEGDRASRFVVLFHRLPPSAGRASHWDWMIEEGDALATWALVQWPDGRGVPARRLADHRRHYLTYEGPVSGNRGTVRRVLAGLALPLACPPPARVYALCPLGGILVLEPLAGGIAGARGAPAPPSQWLVRWHRLPARIKKGRFNRSH